MIQDRTLPSQVLKRSINIDGRKTSVSLEDEFWRALREIAVIQNLRVSEFVSQIAKNRQNKNLSSAIRVFVLDHYRRPPLTGIKDSPSNATNPAHR